MLSISSYAIDKVLKQSAAYHYIEWDGRYKHGVKTLRTVVRVDSYLVTYPEGMRVVELVHSFGWSPYKQLNDYYKRWTCRFICK